MDHRSNTDLLRPLPVLAGLLPSPAVRDALVSACPDLRLKPDRRPPHPEGLLRAETATGRPVQAALAGRWHRPPYALGLRLARYAPGSALPDILDHAVIGTRGGRDAFYRHAEQTVLRMVVDTLRGAGRGEAADPPPPELAVNRAAAWIDRTRARWSEVLSNEWWSLGVTAMSPDAIIRTGELGLVTWLQPKAGDTYLADPFPWPGTSEILCEEMPVRGGLGRIVAVSPDGRGGYARGRTILADRQHHSYPCTYSENGTTWLLPEATDRGSTVLYRLAADGRLDAVCAIAPDRRLADATLFRHAGRYWIACTDIDIGPHDSLCLLHAERLDGPWMPHRLHPVRVDIRGARPAGGLFRIGDALFRPGQNCSVTYGGGITIHRVDVLTPEDYHETAVVTLSPNPDGPFPHGLHTLVSDGARTWIDGKRLVSDWRGALGKAARRAMRPYAGSKSPASAAAGVTG